MMSVTGVATTAGASSANNLQRNRNLFLRRNLRYASFLVLVICCGIWLVIRSGGMVEIFSPLSRTMDDAMIITNHYYSASKNHSSDSSGSGSSRSNYETDIVANTTTVNNNVIVAAATTTTPAATLVSNHNDDKRKITKEESKLFVVKQKQNKQQQQQKQNNNNNNEHRIKFYAVHIGPSKTGTSAIQKDLVRNILGVNTLRKEKDDIIYVGKLIATNGKSKIWTIHGKLITIHTNARCSLESRIVCWNS